MRSYQADSRLGSQEPGNFLQGCSPGINLVNIQLGLDLYEIPVRAITGMTEAKVPGQVAALGLFLMAWMRLNGQTPNL